MITLEMLEEECEIFLQNHFTKYYKKIDPHLDFIEEHDLFETKKNLLNAYDFLDELFEQFRSHHAQFPSSTCIKLYITVKHLYQIYLSLKEEAYNSEQLFEHNFIADSVLLLNYKHQLQNAKKQHFRAKVIQELQNSYDKLYSLYGGLFQDMFLKYRQDVFYFVKTTLNTYLLYFDAILWQDALKSSILQRYFDTIKLKSYTTKQMLLHDLATTSKATIRYAYLQKALKAY